jgi:hypothetical protein
MQLSRKQFWDSPGVIAELGSLPRPLDLNTVYPEPKRQPAAESSLVAQ